MKRWGGMDSFGEQRPWVQWCFSIQQQSPLFKDTSFWWYVSSKAEVFLDEVNSQGRKFSMMNSTATVFASRGKPHQIVWILAAYYPNNVGVQLTVQPCIVWDQKWAQMQLPICVYASGQDIDLYLLSL